MCVCVIWKNFFFRFKNLIENFHTFFVFFSLHFDARSAFSSDIFTIGIDIVSEVFFCFLWRRNWNWIFMNFLSFFLRLLLLLVVNYFCCWLLFFISTTEEHENDVHTNQWQTWWENVQIDTGPSISGLISFLCHKLNGLLDFEQKHSTNEWATSFLVLSLSFFALTFSRKRPSVSRSVFGALSHSLYISLYCKELRVCLLLLVVPRLSLLYCESTKQTKRPKNCPTNWQFDS